jgi:hypothetical protein
MTAGVDETPRAAGLDHGDFPAPADSSASGVWARIVPPDPGKSAEKHASQPLGFAGSRILLAARSRELHALGARLAFFGVMVTVVPPKTAARRNSVSRAPSLLAAALAVAGLACLTQFLQHCQASAHGMARKYPLAASQTPRKQAEVQNSDYVWRRTVKGWERLRIPPATIIPHRPTLHPLILALLELLLALMALIGFSPTRS